MAEALAAIGPGRSRDGKWTVAAGTDLGLGAAQVGADTAKGSAEPSWMQPTAA